MIESYYWRQALAEDLKWLKAKRTFKRWSEKQMVLFERRILLVAFQVRTLLEQKRVGAGGQAACLPCVKFPKVGSKPVTRLNRTGLEEHFALLRPEATELEVWDLCNQLIHQYVLFAASEPGAFAILLVFSDFKKNDCLYRIAIPELLEFFSQYAKDQSGARGQTLTWNPQKSDYDVSVT
jgi:hypothetical protein